ncbi:helix-turn-helix domain-containing protein [Lysinibacillus piscis]|uniref:Fe3+-hydroxamate ABC transporter substrate-binding protein n=1 Tax=Lysinibacillus piscis TaxID=2518931 RepID=A0ABQ5NLI5_9BACI|nr:helix-turn-helix domain-containing protein [Lysinibacillus sp. KH24]GLC88909.1 hypothetical protein LYSBPC_20360 [Lysinibacillus sp. KH24]
MQDKNTSTFLFQLIDITYISQRQPLLTAAHYTLIIFKQGNGTLTIDEQPHVVTKGKIFLIQPYSTVDISTIDEDACFYQITFSAFQTVHQELAVYKGQLFSEQVAFTLYPYTRFLRLTENLYKLKQHPDYLKQQSLLYELFSMLFEPQLHKQHTLNMTKAVEQTIDYIHTCYQQTLTVKELAELACIAQWQYSAAFQTITGKKPLDYITDLRLQKAKKLLEQTNEPLKNIAQRVGFDDEYYFNRRFRQIVGVPPKQYARQQRQKVLVTDWTGHKVEIPYAPHRIIYHGETFGDMLIFNIQPIGGYKSIINKSVYKHHVPAIQDVAFPIDIQKSSMLNPDLIIFTNSDEQQYQNLADIAPTVTHNSWDTLDERIRLLGNWLSQKQRAEDWLSHYQQKETHMWQQLQSVIQSGETASVFIIDHGNRLFAMGCTGLSPTLFHPQGFQPQKHVQKLLQARLGYKEITVDELPQYAGDRIFMLLSDQLNAQIATLDLMNNDIWKSLPAVQKNHVYLIDAAKWNYNDAFTREKLLHALPQLLGHIS